MSDLAGPTGKLYSQLPHPAFSDWPLRRDASRRQAIIAPHLAGQGGTALDVGAYLGAFSHWLEDLGYRVTAVERNRSFARVAREVRDLCGKSFELFEGSYHELPNATFDVVLALNVFDQAGDRPERWTQLEQFLARLDCRMVIFEGKPASLPLALDESEGRDPNAFARFVAANVGLNQVEQIGADGAHRIYKLTYRDPNAIEPDDPSDAAVNTAIPAAETKPPPAAAKPRTALDKADAGELPLSLTGSDFKRILTRSVEELVGSRIGTAVRQVSETEHVRPAVSKEKRRYFRHHLQAVDDGAGDVVVFSKAGIGAPGYLQQIESVLGNEPRRCFRAPRFYGINSLEDGPRRARIAVWEFVAGRSYLVADASPAILDRMAAAAADIATLADAMRLGVPRLRSRVSFLKPLAARLHDRLASLHGLHQAGLLHRLADQLARHEPGILERLNAMGDTALCHMDFGNSNVVFPPEEGPPIVIDWETTCFGPHGATLRKLAMVDPRLHFGLAARYAATLGSHGVAVDPRDALFAMRAVQVYYFLDLGCRRDAAEAATVERALNWGLTNLHLLGE